MSYKKLLEMRAKQRKIKNLDEKLEPLLTKREKLQGRVDEIWSEIKMNVPEILRRARSRKTEIIQEIEELDGIEQEMGKE